MSTCDVLVGSPYTLNHLILRTIPILQLRKLELMWIKKLEAVASEVKRRFSNTDLRPKPKLFLFCCGTRASHCCGLSHCGAQAPDTQAQRPWLTGPAAPQHVGSSRTGSRTRVSCIGRQTLNHCATREAR